MDFKFIIAADIHVDSPMQGLSRYEGAPSPLLENQIPLPQSMQPRGAINAHHTGT